jgi:hypothetical protein
VATDAHLTLLDELGAGGHSHSGRTLLDHLRGTSDLLLAWGNPPETCVAGLFHSIYGTRDYPFRSVELAQRGRIRDAIGEPAEEIVYLYCVTDRAELWGQIGCDQFVLHDAVRDAQVVVPPHTLRALLEVHVANYLEMLPRKRFGADEVGAFRKDVEAAQRLLSAGAYQGAKSLTLHSHGRRCGESQR